MKLRRKLSWDSRPACQPRFVRLQNVLAEVTQFGQGEPIVLIPGLAGGSRLLMPLAERLAERHSVWVIGSPAERSFVSSRPLVTLSDHAAYVAELVEALGLERPTVVGVSFGAAVALHLALERPHVAGALALSGIEAVFSHRPVARMLSRLLERYPLPADHPFLNQFFNLLHASRDDAHTSLARFVIECCWETDQVEIARRLRMLESYDVSEDVHRVEVPTLIFAGAADAIVPPARQRALAEAMCDARFVQQPRAGHLAFLSHRQEFAQRIAELVDSREAAVV
jgi:pimeloyl-ACP methyl ester carboxylesterase